MAACFSLLQSIMQKSAWSPSNTIFQARIIHCSFMQFLENNINTLVIPKTSTIIPRRRGASPALAQNVSTPGCDRRLSRSAYVGRPARAVLEQMSFLRQYYYLLAGKSSFGFGPKGCVYAAMLLVLSEL